MPKTAPGADLSASPVAIVLPTQPQHPVTRTLTGRPRPRGRSRHAPLPPAGHEVGEDLRERHADVPAGIVLAGLSEVAVVADVVADPVRLDVGRVLLPAGQGRDSFERLEDRARVRLP